MNLTPPVPPDGVFIYGDVAKWSGRDLQNPQTPVRLRPSPFGWNLAFGDFKEIGAKPVGVFLAATIFNTVLAFIVSWVLFA